MKKRGYFLGLILATLLFLPTSVLAVCDYSEQNQLSAEAANVKFSYEAGIFKTGRQVEPAEYIIPGTYDEDGNFIPDENFEVPLVDETVIEKRLHLYNLTENIYVVLRDDYFNEEIRYHFEDSEEGTIEWTESQEVLEERVHYTLTIYAEDENCVNGSLRKIELTTPQFNPLSLYVFCENSNEYYCQQFSLVDINTTEEDLMEKYQKPEESSQNSENREEDFIKTYGLYIILSIVAIGVIGVIAFVIIRKTQRSAIK